MKTTILLLLSTVALQTVAAVPSAYAASDNALVAPLVVAQADDKVAAARRALEQAQASLKQAEDTGGDVRGARKAVAAAMMNLRAAEAAGGGSAGPSAPPASKPAPVSPPAPAGNGGAATGQPKPYTPPAPAVPEKPKAPPVVKSEPKAAPKVEPKVEPTTPPKAAPKIEPKAEQKIETKTEPKAQSKPRPIPEQTPAAPTQPAPVIKRPPPIAPRQFDRPNDQPRPGEREVPPPYDDRDAGPRPRDYGRDYDNGRPLPPAGIPEGRGETTTTEIRPNGVRILTITDRDGRVLRRIRVDRYGNRTVMSDFDRPMGRPDYYDGQPPEPPRFRPGRDGYVLNGDNASEAEIEGTLGAAPIERPRRGYSIDEIRRDPDVRNMVRRVDLDTITFDFGSDEVSNDQIGKLRTIGRAIGRILDRNPREVFLIEGHTDAVGTDLANLELSDRRANSVSDILSEYFDIPPENLVSQGYGERDLKIPTDAPERQNRRVTVRRITPLLRGGY